MGSSLALETSPASSTGAGGHALVEHFLASSVPPILTSIEVGPRWTTTKMLLASLAASSPMVRYAMMTFSAIELGESEGLRPNHQALYDKAAKQLSDHVTRVQRGDVDVTAGLQFALTAAFFLAYSDLLAKRLGGAQQILRDAVSLIRSHRKKHLSAIERRLVAWLRLVDGRASSAGGDGAFLDETDDTPQEEHLRSSVPVDGSSGPADAEHAIEIVLFDVLYSPGLAFYQRVQSIMARVTRLDPWHRSRGTVTDETEVMASAAMINHDLHILETERPALMDHAVAGSLTGRYLAPDIANAITKSYRTYWANYSAGYIHLHRVAYKHLPANTDVLDARTAIKRIARFFETEHEPMPTNMIWPLLMACCEEDGLEDRKWMIQTIRDMHGSATNAKPIADVLEEVHRRQDANKQRADVRQTSMDLFNMSFAVV
ncbi:hypothetical protein BAUCODRAFT_65816 [Baudoinia panamericana UAMH 10762]|uniref:Uncharacterized protein n=1 Tax=Baudoinia panamericana (strain UAMH 10762) TaxID=717646 RepID=M2N5G4_BAUPA|nr:uncharacterized protein BAUCODRAFT_65816 [Baudoinia panamericana UAMH 10762]EMC99273.1 hypothetical protein BAUCODRAFT_65816 [Baudoinia panamericana UAMH 10762]